MTDTADLTLSREDMIQLGYAVVERVVEHMCGLREQRAARISTAESLRKDISRDMLRTEPAPASEVLEEAVASVFGNTSPLDHPRFFAFVPSPGNYVGFLADALVAGFNPFAGSWLEAAGPARVESELIAFLSERAGLPTSAEGAFVSGGTMGLLTALVVAREQVGDPARRLVYCSDQAHGSLRKVMRVLGFEHDELRVIPSRDDFVLDVAALSEALADDRSMSGRPLMILATAGTTNTGAVDPFRELRQLADEHGAWMHVDGAYGGALLLSKTYRGLLDGVETADSISLDPHKWLFQPYECGCFLVRHSGALEEAFSEPAEYLDDLDRYSEGVDFHRRGVQLTRSFRALKLWMSLRTFGLMAFGGAIDRGCELADYAESRIRKSRDLILETPAALGIVTFRHASAASDSETHTRIVDRLLREGTAFVTCTRLRGKSVLRLCTINPRTRKDDIDATLDAIVDAGVVS